MGTSAVSRLWLELTVAAFKVFCPDETKGIFFKHEKKTEKSQQTDHERPYLVLVVEKLNGQIDLTNKNIFIDGRLGNIVIEAYQVNRIGKKVASPIERIKRGGNKK